METYILLTEVRVLYGSLQLVTPIKGTKVELGFKKVR